MRQTTLVALAAVLWFAAPAAAQAPLGPSTSGSSQPYLTVFGGAAAVQHVGAEIGGELGWTATDRLEVFGEGLWAQDAVTRRRLDTAQTVATFLQSTQGQTATATVKAPSSFGGGGVRFLLSPMGSLRPYLTVEAGIASVQLKPTFTLGGSDATAGLPLYGVTLGSDLSGSTTNPAIGGGFGLRSNGQSGKMFFDVGVRVLSIRTAGQATNVIRAIGGVGMRF